MPPKDNGGSTEIDQAQVEDTLAVDVLMLAFNGAAYIEAAVAGVLKQVTDFPVRLVIADDHSKDSTVEICQRLAAEHPLVVHFVPGERNLGIAGRTAAGLAHCHARYLAICDGDDIWTDPNKLRDQVAFLEANPAYGLCYTDIDIITKTGTLLADDGYDGVRADYAEGDVFVKLLHGNFINNSTTVVRRVLLKGHIIDTDRNYSMHDMLMWLHVSMRTKVHFMPARTTSYRQGGFTSGRGIPSLNRQRLLTKLGGLLLEYADRKAILPAERPHLFRKVLSVLYRSGPDMRTKRALLANLRRFMPGSFAGWCTALGRRDILRHSNGDLRSNAS